ncbi:hypothetical protein GLOIN_2v1792112 [Rhizophagus irregularis DAOM 181602=DAOM 197198]|uniref:Uncharacterized protein n=1 Tax=Rhizophagus irregularis (strain DAOM 197198w) TaxID=1432141 RepID=A0A015LKE5_RHIIW|nr:hypothetical protein RirG_227050 [Rhizophagus irregularis DAOM 197198w]GBC43225.2 hypothetical protein GLOIN_2v1792112 [Rhizophagus irregularis DAOM 181602=DAOM 197198]
MLYKAAENTTDSNLNSSLAGPEKLYIKVTGKKSENHMNANHLMIGQLAIYSHVSAPKTEKGKIFTQIFLFLRTNTSFPGPSLASLLLINQEEDSTITSLEENLINKDILISPLNEEISVITPFEEDLTTISLNEKDNSTTPEYNENEYIFLPRNCTRSYANRPQIMLEHSGTENLSNSDYEQHTDTSSSSDGNESDDETFADTFENYSPPDFKSYQEEEKMTINDKFSWILLWIMTFRKRFNLPETAIESQLKFMKIVLKKIGGDIYDSFSDSLYLVRIQLDLKDHFHSFVPCPKCHKLYNKTDMDEIQKNNSIGIIRCSHVEFPNSVSQKTKSC